MSIFIENYQNNIQLDDNINNILKNDIIDETVYRYVKFHQNKNYNQFVIELFKKFVIEYLKDIHENNILEKLDILNKKINNLQYHFNINFFDIFKEIINNNEYSNIIYNKLLNDLLSLDINSNINTYYLNILYDEQNDNVINKIKKYIITLCNNYESINSKLKYLIKIFDNIYNENSRNFDNLIFNIILINIKNLILSSYDFILNDNNWVYLSAKTYIFDKTTSKICYCIEKKRFNLKDLPLKYKYFKDKIDDFYFFLKYNNETYIKLHTFDSTSKDTMTTIKNIILEKISIFFRDDNILDDFLNKFNKILINKMYEELDVYVFVISSIIKKTDINLKNKFSKTYTKYLINRCKIYEEDYELIKYEKKVNKLFENYYNNNEFIFLINTYLNDISENLEYKKQFMYQLNLKNDFDNTLEGKINFKTYTKEIWNLENKFYFKFNFENTISKYINYYNNFYSFIFRNKRKLNYLANFGNIKFKLKENDKIVIINSLPIYYFLIELFINKKIFTNNDINKYIELLLPHNLDNIINNLIDKNVILKDNDKYFLNDISKINNLIEFF